MLIIAIMMVIVTVVTIMIVIVHIVMSVIKRLSVLLFFKCQCPTYTRASPNTNSTYVQKCFSQGLENASEVVRMYWRYIGMTLILTKAPDWRSK